MLSAIGNDMSGIGGGVFFWKKLLNFFQKKCTNISMIPIRDGPLEMRRKFTKTYHIIFDAFGCDRKFLDDERFVLDLLFEIPKLIKMRILSGPNIVRDYDNINPGVTGFCIVDFSHISIHTFTKTKEIFIDVFSCRFFDRRKVKNYLFAKLKTKPEQVEIVEIKYPWE